MDVSRLHIEAGFLKLHILSNFQLFLKPDFNVRPVYYIVACMNAPLRGLVGTHNGCHCHVGPPSVNITHP